MIVVWNFNLKEWSELIIRAKLPPCLWNLSDNFWNLGKYCGNVAKLEETWVKLIIYHACVENSKQLHTCMQLGHLGLYMRRRRRRSEMNQDSGSDEVALRVTALSLHPLRQNRCRRLWRRGRNRSSNPLRLSRCQRPRRWRRSTKQSIICADTILRTVRWSTT